MFSLQAISLDELFREIATVITYNHWLCSLKFHVDDIDRILCPYVSG